MDTNVKAELAMILNISDYKVIEEIEEGSSGDKKYKLQKNNRFYLLRVGDRSAVDIKRKEYERLGLLAATDVRTHIPIDFGVIGDIFYSIVSWVDGTSVMDVIKSDLSKSYYELGRKAGIELRKIHSISTDIIGGNWFSFICEKANSILQICNNVDIGDIGNKAKSYMLNNLDLAKNRSCVLLHGDYHWGNCVLNDKGEIGVIDFSGDSSGDPWYEFGGMVWVLEYSEDFANGQLDGYFNTVPDEFWHVFKLYIAIYAFEHLAKNSNNIENCKMNAVRILQLFGEDFSADIPLFRNKR